MKLLIYRCQKTNLIPNTNQFIYDGIEGSLEISDIFIKKVNTDGSWASNFGR